jgi:hypothetical protein
MGNIWRPTSIFVGPLIKGLADATQVVELLRSVNAGLRRFGSELECTEIHHPLPSHAWEFPDAHLLKFQPFRRMVFHECLRT